MSSDDLPEGIRDFVSKYVTSVAALEVLLFLHARSPRGFSVEEISQELRSNASHIENILTELEATGLVGLEVMNGTRFSSFRPKTAELDQLMGRLAAVATQKRRLIIEQIYAKPPEKLTVFSDAFKIRK